MASNSPDARTSGRIPRIQELHQELVNNVAAKAVATTMYARGALTKKEFESVQCSRTPTEAAETLLGFLQDTSSDRFRSFLDALKDSRREDVYQSLIYGNLPLSVTHIDLLRQHYKFLLDNMETKDSGLVVQLYANEVLDRSEKDDIMYDISSSGSTEKLLSVIARKSANDYRRFLDALDKTGQKHVADVIRSTDKSDTQTVNWKDQSLELQKQLYSAQKRICELDQEILIQREHQERLSKEADKRAVTWKNRSLELQQQLDSAQEEIRRLQEENLSLKQQLEQPGEAVVAGAQATAKSRQLPAPAPKPKNQQLSAGSESGDSTTTSRQGDSGYPLQPWLLTPLSSPATQSELAYNAAHTKTRNVVERCFGVMKSRFRCLDKSGGTLLYSPQKACKIFIAVAVLHNFCIGRNLTTPADADVLQRHAAIQPQTAAAMASGQSSTASDLRRRIVQQF